jgi:hypothetical protein
MATQRQQNRLCQPTEEITRSSDDGGLRLMTQAGIMHIRDYYIAEAER